MTTRRKAFLSFLLCLVLAASSASAQIQERVPVVRNTGNVIRVVADDIPADVVDADLFMRTGEVKLRGGLENSAPSVIPGPAPAPYPHVHMWDGGIEQLGASPSACDGISFINGRIWIPLKWMLVMWKIRIPDPGDRYASEFERDLSLSMWIDFNQDRTWGKNEKVIGQNLNIQQYFPDSSSYIEIWYLTWFRFPVGSDIGLGGNRMEEFATKLWVRCILSYDDGDVSPDGECLFGEVEDYEVFYFEQQDTRYSTKG